MNCEFLWFQTLPVEFTEGNQQHKQQQYQKSKKEQLIPMKIQTEPMWLHSQTLIVCGGFFSLLLPVDGKIHSNSLYQTKIAITKYL